MMAAGDIYSTGIPADMCLCMVTAINALTFITEPAIWPSFVAFMEQNGGGINGEPEKIRMRIRDSEILHIHVAHSSRP